MAIFVVAVGAVSAALGCWAIYYGYGIVQVERGWATLIAGAVGLSGGLITAALGLVLLRLTSILDAVRTSGVVAEPAHVAQDRIAPTGTVPLAVPPADAAQLELGLAAPVVGALGQDRETASAAPLAEAPEPTIDAVPVAHVEPAAEELPQTHPADVPDAFAHPAESGSDAHAAPSQEAIDDMWRAVGEELSNTDWAARETPAVGAIDLQAPGDHVGADLAIEDEISALLGESAVGQARTHPAAHQLSDPEPDPVPSATSGLEVMAPDHVSSAEQPGETAFDHILQPPAPPAFTPHLDPVIARDVLEPQGASSDPMATAEPEPLADPVDAYAASPEPQPAAAPHVIGRYEADGTTYTMYADGSIEAQSPDGLYRFPSMAELKAFIERTV